jgi:hypothetical protein
MLRGDLCAIPTITPEERTTLLFLATEFNQYHPAIRETPRAQGANAGDRPGDRWAATVTWADILGPHGWVALRQSGDKIYWRRPGKDTPDCSATTNYGGYDTFHVFSSNAAPFDSEKGYTKFTAYVMLNHDSDWKAATRAVAALGFGDPPTTRPAPEPPAWLDDAPWPDEPPDYAPETGTHPKPTAARLAATQAPEPATPSTWADMAATVAPIRWAWHPWLADGFLHLLASNAGIGKSALALRIAACYLCGMDWPDGTAYEGEPGAVLWCEAEGAQALNLARARSWRLPLERIVTPLADPLADVNLADNRHMAAIKAAATRPDVRLIVLDSLSGARAGADENDSRVLVATKALAQIARDTGKPVIATHHLRKRGLLDGDAVTLDRLRGSSAVTQMARLVWALDKPDKQSDALRLSTIKSNLAKYAPPIGLSFGDDGRLSFGDAPTAPDSVSEIEAAAHWLQSVLAAGPMLSSDLLLAAEAGGIAARTLHRAKAGLNVKSAKKGSAWMWSL